MVGTMTYDHGEPTADDNALPVDLEAQGTVSTLNSTKTPLVGDGTFTGEWEDIAEFQTMLISGGTDVPATLYAEVSTNGKGDPEDITVVQLSNGLDGFWGPHTLSRISRFFRIRIANGSTDQTKLTLQVIFGHSANIALPTSRAAQIVGDYTDVINTRIMTEPFLDEINGKQANRQAIQKFGHNDDVAADTTEIVAGAGGTYTGWLEAATAVRIRSGGDAADDSGGDGARKIRVEGLDENWEIVEEEIITNGASVSSATTITFIRVNRAYVTDVGLYGATNTGDIIVETTGGALVADIHAEHAESEGAFYTIPSGKIGFVRAVSASVEGTKPASIDFWCRPDADVVIAPFTSPRVFFGFAKLDSYAARRFLSYKGPFAAKTDIYVTASPPTGSNPSVSASFDLVLVDENGA